MDVNREESLTTQRSRVDRFTIPREKLPELSRRIFWKDHHEEYCGEIWSTKYLQQKKYMNFLDEAFNLTPLRPKNSKSQEDWCWPCLPRKKSYLSTADNVLDLPSYRSSTFPDILDWTINDILVAALGKSYHKWSWQTQALMDQGSTHFQIHCCKFDPYGKYLLLGTDLRVEVHNELSKCISVQYCACAYTYPKCFITTVDWSPTGDFFVTGCSRGTICSMNPRNMKARPLKSNQLLSGATQDVKISPNARYVAVAGVYGRRVWVLSWPDLTLFRSLRTYQIIKAMCWHPWQSSMLSVATLSWDLRSHIIILDPNVEKFRQEKISRGCHSIDAMKFNHRTGELLLSLWRIADDDHHLPKSSELVVMSDFETVVDHWGEGRTGLDRIRTMVFNPDGTKLATATKDEDLIIWNFLPNDYKMNSARQNFAAVPQYLDICANGFSIR